MLSNRDYVAYLIVASAAMVALFAYAATSAFVLRSMNGLSPLAYSLSFAANAAGMTAAALVSARLADRMGTPWVIFIGQVPAPGAGMGRLMNVIWLGAPLLLAPVGFFVLMLAIGLVLGNAGALANAAAC